MYKLFFLLLITSCVGVKKATKVFNENRGEAASYCAETFPSNDSTFFVEGKEFIHDTIQKLQTIFSVEKINDTVIKKVTEIKTILKTVVRVDTLYRTTERTDKIEAKEYEMQQLKSSFNYITKEAEKWEARAKQNMKWLLILSALVLIFVVLKIKNVIK